MLLADMKISPGRLSCNGKSCRRRRRNKPTWRSRANSQSIEQRRREGLENGRRALVAAGPQESSSGATPSELPQSERIHPLYSSRCKAGYKDPCPICNTSFDTYADYSPKVGQCPGILNGPQCRDTGTLGCFSGLNRRPDPNPGFINPCYRQFTRRSP